MLRASYDAKGGCKDAECVWVAAWLRLPLGL